MNNVRLSPEQQQEVCEDLLCIAQARRLEELVLLRRQMLSECRPPSALQWVDADFIARQASTLIGGTPGYWRDAAAAALGRSSRVESSIEAVRQVAADVRWQEPPQQAPLPVQVNVANRKRGGR